MSNDFKRLDIERAKIAVSVQQARDLVSGWMGDDFDDSEPGKLAIPVLQSSTAGLGSKIDKPAPTSKALERLQRAHKHASSDTKGARTGSKANGHGTKSKHAARARSDSESDSEDGSRTSSVRAKQRTHAKPGAHRTKRAKRGH